ncbi:MAG: hypothetical protein SPD47_03185 [Oscillospiraceae bacterium]|nr:hypothetical protein [Oscillospiraceae bacterium]
MSTSDIEKELERDEKFDEELIKENLCPELKIFLNDCMERVGNFTGGFDLGAWDGPQLRLSDIERHAHSNEGMSYPNRLAAGAVRRGLSAYAKHCRKAFAVCEKYVRCKSVLCDKAQNELRNRGGIYLGKQKITPHIGEFSCLVYCLFVSVC